MQKTILNALQNRYATKSFDTNRKISDKDMDVMLESLRLSPSSFGLQPWKFIKLENPDLRKELLPYSRNQKQIVDASDLIIFCMPTNIDANYISKYLESVAKTRWTSIESLQWYAKMMYDFVANASPKDLKLRAHEQIFIALGFLLQTSALLGIDSCAIWWFDKTKYDEIIGLKEKNLTSVVVCPLWYRSSDDKYATVPKVRFDMDEVLIKM